MLGIDSEGHAANFVETEQIVHYNGNRASFVQASACVGGRPVGLFYFTFIFCHVEIFFFPFLFYFSLFFFSSSSFSFFETGSLSCSTG